jgi:carboxyl-terminal processing protease
MKALRIPTRLVRWLPLVVAGLLLLSEIPLPASASEPLTCERIPELTKTYLHKHISFHYVNDELRQRLVDSYVKRLDPSKSLYLADEAKELERNLRGVIQDVREGNCTALMAIHEDQVARFERLEKFVQALLESPDYALDTDAVLIIDPDKRAWPKTEETRKELVTKLVHFQMSNYLASDMPLDEAKQKLIKRYQLSTRRAKERTTEDLYASYLDAFATALDPHSNYLSRDVLEDFQISMGLSLEGIGVALSSRDGYSIVEKVIPGGAADGLGILEPNDKIIAVAQEGADPVDIIDMDLRDVVRLIRGKRGTKVHLTILRQGDTTERFQVSIVREKINLEEQAAKLRFEEMEIDGKKHKLAVLDLPSFYGGRNPGERQSSRDVQRLLEQAREEKATGLLLDLSRNGGGLLENSVEIAGFFLEKGGVVAVRDTFSKVQVLRDRDRDIVWDGPLVVLTSRVSASASEIVAGALKDYRRAVIVGDDHTFGKGTVQSMVPLPEGLGALKVTTALFFRPGGKSTQNAGVAADVTVPSVFATDDFGEKHQTYSLPSQTITPFIDFDEMPALASTERGVPWRPVTDEVLAELARRSEARVTASEDFAKVRERIAKAEERNGVVHLDDLMKEKKEEEQENARAEAEASTSESGDEAADVPVEAHASASDEDEPSPQQREALNVLADLIRLTT